MKKKNSIFTVVFYAVLAFVILFAVAALFMGNGGEQEVITDKDILGYLENDEFKEFILDDNGYLVGVVYKDGVEKEIEFQ